MIYKKLINLIFIALFFSPLNAQVFFDVEKIKKHVTYLASDELEGRGTGTRGEKKAAKYIAKQFKELGIAPKGKGKSYFQEFPFTASGFHGNVTRGGIATNVIGFLDNKALYTIVIGAHYDHLGNNEDGHSLDAEGKGKIHNGADDNASGVAGVIELARYFSKNNVREPFNFLFICFSAEELGLLGSKYFCDHPTLSLDSVTAMINMDMIGRLKKDEPVLTISGTGTSPVWEPTLQKFNSNAMRIRFDSSGVGPSDHTSFYKKNIPALHFFSGTHADYHKPTDDAHLLNYKGQEAILFLISELIDQLPSNEKLTFLTTKTKSTASVSKFKVTLGIMPSYAESGKGLEVEAVIDGKPAQKAGVKNGDIILQIGDYAVTGIQDYMDVLSKFNKGDQTNLKVKRGLEIISLIVDF